MKKIFKKLKNVRLKIQEKRTELRNIDDSFYYNTIGKSEKDRDRLEIQCEIKSLLKLEFSILENIKTKTEIEKAKNSYESRTLNLIINNNERLV